MQWVTYEPRKHLSKSEIYSSEGNCPICSYAGYRKKSMVIQSDPDVILLSCPNCSGLSVSHMPKAEVLEQLYKDYYENSDKPKVIFHNPLRLARHIISMIAVGSRSSQDIRILDFGGGDGSISRAAGELISAETQRPVHIQVVDYVDGNPERKGLVDIEFVHELRNASSDCDLVIASGVFEHVPGLASLLPDLFRKLRIGGSLYARTLYGLPLMKLFGFDMNYPAHVHDLGDQFWSNFPQWFSVPVKIDHSRPSIIETEFRQAFVRTIAAYCFKLPARIECLWTRNPMFKLYGGWEVALQRTA